MTDQCIHCGLCTKQCSVLQKYGMDLSALSAHPELAYHCFLCGECARICPKSIDGRTIALAMRQKRTAQAGGKLTEKGYSALVAEKQNYLFKNYHRTTGNAALFPGCNFPSFFPKTTDKLIQLFNSAGIGTVFDCCGKPIGDLGLTEKECNTIFSLQTRLTEAGIHRLVVLCPNCYYYLKSHTNIEVVTVYEVLQELNLGNSISKKIPLFLPCPDRTEQHLLQHLRHFAPYAVPIRDIQCCGLGGCAGAKEPEIAASFCRSLHEQHHSVYTYCASCAGQLRRGGIENTTHILTEILDMHEKPVLSPVQSLWNRAKRIL